MMIRPDLSASRRLCLGVFAVAALAAPAVAHPDRAGDGDRRVERVVVISDSRDGGEQAKGERSRRIEIVTSGDGEHRVRTLTDGCSSGDKSEVNETSADGREKTRILVCGQGISAAERAQRLQEALDRVEKNDRIRAEHKERVAAALREAIDRLRDTR